MGTDAPYAGLELELGERSFEAYQVCRDSLTMVGCQMDMQIWRPSDTESGKWTGQVWMEIM